MSYYHTYRPNKFADLAGQEHIVTILQEALAKKRLAHAYLFCGTRGTGKTTTARLLAKAVNCPNLLKEAGKVEACGQCQICQMITAGSCLDVIEIDAASNRGIEEMKELQQQLRFKPQLTERKIFIIDEVHMLTKEAFNALLKTLEEPPAYLLFILATTEVHKLPATVISRCQRFDFLTPNSSTLSQYLERIASSEGLSLDGEAALTLGELAQGSFRDAATLLEQLSVGHQKIGAELINKSFGLPDQGLVERYLLCLDGKDDQSLSADLDTYFRRGGNPSYFIDRCFTTLSKLIIEKKSFRKPARVMAQLIESKRQMKYSPIAELPITIGLISAGEGSVESSEDAVAAKPTNQSLLTESQTKRPISSSEPELTAVEVVTTPMPKSETDSSPIENDTEPIEVGTVDVAEQVVPIELPDHQITEYWQKALEALLKDNQSSLVAILRTGSPLSWQSPVLRIGVQFKFHADQLNRRKNRDILESVFSAAFGTKVLIETDIQPITDLVSAVNEVFG